MIQIQVNTNSLVAMAKLTLVQAVLDDPAPLLDEAGAFLLNRIRTRFLAEKAPDDTPWTPSKAAVARRGAGGTGTLFDTGRLFHSIQLATIGEDRVIGTDVPYAPYLHFGFHHWKSGKFIGPWPFMGFSDGDVDILTNLLEIRLADLIKKAID